MNDKYFLDTNILVYTFDEQQPEKRKVALALLEDALQSGNGAISWQVIQEFLNVATRKFTVPMKTDDANLYLQKILYPLCRVYPDLEIYENALALLEKTGFSWYDSLIVASAIQAGCGILYSEDLQNRQMIESVRITNPFLAE